MTNKTGKKIVIISDIKSANIEEAIFILKDNPKASNCDILDEANEIVQNYIRKSSAAKMKELKKKGWFGKGKK